MSSIQVLHVDDEPDFGPLVATFIERVDDRFEVLTTTGANDALDRLDDDIDCIVSDFDMPDMNGLELLEVVREEYPDLPFILFTGKGSEEIASEAISRGVTDYHQKETSTDQYTVLANRIANEVERFRSNKALKKREKSLARAQRIAKLGNWDLHLPTNELFWSDQIHRIFGVDPAEFEESYEAFLAFVHPDDRRDLEAAVDTALEEDVSYDFEHRIIRPDGEERVVRERAEVIRTDEGEPIVMSGVVQDITE